MTAETRKPHIVPMELRDGTVIRTEEDIAAAWAARPGYHADPVVAPGGEFADPEIIAEHMAAYEARKEREAAAIEGRPKLSNVRTLSAPPEIETWHIEGLARPKAIVVVGSAEGVGKSMMRKEIEMRLGSGIGPLFGHFPIPGPLTVATFEEENGDAEEYRRDDQTMAALGIDRQALGDRIYRVSYPGINLCLQTDQEYVRAELEKVHADVVWFDTGGSMIGDEWGEPMKVAFRFLRSLEVTVFLNVHLVKPSRTGGRGQSTHGSALSDVMGQWTRQADAVCIVSDLGEGRVKVLVRKRVKPQELILAQRDGLWVVVAQGGATKTRSTTVDKVLRAIAGGLTTAGEIMDALELKRSTVFDALSQLRKTGLISPREPYGLTEAGEEASG